MVEIMQENPEITENEVTKEEVQEYFNSEKTEKKEVGTIRKHILPLTIGFLFSFAVMVFRGLLKAEDAKTVALAVCDGFCVAGLLYTAAGSLAWVSNDGFFDSMKYMLWNSWRFFIPIEIGNKPRDFYTYKQECNKKREKKKKRVVVPEGLVLLVLGIISLIVYNQL